MTLLSVAAMSYRLARPFLFSMPPETAHHLAFAGLVLADGSPVLRRGIARARGAFDRTIAVRAMGLDFPSPLGLAAGFDKDARAYHTLLAMGFGFVEVGTLTAHAQPGNPRPRMFRLPRDRALVNRLGFNNGGSEAAAARLAHRDRSAGIVGVNIGKSKVTPEDEAAKDYELSARRLAPFADYMVVNVSSPNTPGLRNLQAVEKLEPILATVARANAETVERPLPLLVKIAPDLADDDVDAVTQLANTLGLAGIVATNTTISRAGLVTPSAEVEALGAGGLSGAPLEARALEVLARVRRSLAPSSIVIAAGGIMDAASARRRLEAGATLIQAYTGFVYGGPSFPMDIAQGLARPV